MEEQSLIDACIKGDSRAQKKLYEKYAPAMMGVCLRYTGDRETARDLMQDGFVTLFTKIDTYTGKGSFPGWIRKIFVNTALEYLRNNRNMLTSGVDIEEALSILDNDVSIIEALSANELLACVMKLPEDYRTVFNLYAIEGYIHAEIAQMLDIREATARSKYLRARQLLQKMLVANRKYINIAE